MQCAQAARTIGLCALLLLAVAGADARKARKAFAPAPAPATAEEPLLEGEAILRAVQEAGFELTPEEIALLELETVAAAPAPAGAFAFHRPASLSVRMPANSNAVH